MHRSHRNTIGFSALVVLLTPIGCRNTSSDGQILVQPNPLSGGATAPAPESGLRGSMHPDSRRAAGTDPNRQQGDVRSASHKLNTQATASASGASLSLSDSGDAATSGGLTEAEKQQLREAFANASPEIRALAERRMAGQKEGSTASLSDSQERIPSLPNVSSPSVIQQTAASMDAASNGAVVQASTTTATNTSKPDSISTDPSSFGMPDLGASAAATPDPESGVASVEDPAPADTSDPESKTEAGVSAKAAAKPDPVEPTVSAAESPTPKATDHSSESVADVAASAEADEATPPVNDIPPSLSETSETELLAELMRRRQQRIEAAGEEAALEDVVQLRMLTLMDGRPDDAVASVDSWSAAEQDYLNFQMLSLWQLINPEAHPVRERRWTMALPHLREATSHLGAATGSLDVRSLQFCKEVNAFGQTVQFDSSRFSAGQQVILYCEVENYGAERLSDGFETHLRGSYQVLDASGRRVAEQVLADDRQTCANYRRDYFLPYILHLPKQLEPGNYRFELTLEDVKGKKYGQATIPFEIVDGS